MRCANLIIDVFVGSKASDQEDRLDKSETMNNQGVIGPYLDRVHVFCTLLQSLQSSVFHLLLHETIDLSENGIEYAKQGVTGASVSMPEM